MEDTYSVSNTVLVAVAPREGSVFTRETLGAIEELTEAAWRTPYSSRVDSLTSYNHSRALGDELIVEPLVDDARSLSDAGLARIEEIALNATELAGRLVSHDGRVAGLAINFIMPEDQSNALTDITGHLNTVLDEAHASHLGVDFHLTGDVILNHTIAVAMSDGLQTILPVAFFIIVIGTVLLLRSVLGTLAIIVLFAFAINTTFGFAGWVGLVFSPLTAAMPVTILVLAVAHSIHILTAVVLNMRHGVDRNAAIAKSLRSNIYPVGLASLTTVIGFLSLNASNSPPIRGLGNLVAFGMFCVFVYSMTLLPALLSILPLRARLIRTARSPFFERFGAFVVERSTFLLWFVAMLSVTLVIGIPRNEASDNWTKQFDDRYQFRRDTDFIMKNLTGLNSLEYSLSAGREGGITDPEYLRKIDAFAEWYRGQPEVTHVRAFSDIMKRLNKNMHGDEQAFYQLPDNPALAAQYLLLYELSLPFGSDLNDRIDVARSATRMTITLGDLPNRVLREIDARAQVWLRANMPDFVGEASGLSMIFAQLTQRNMHSMLRGTFIGMALISFTLIWFFKNLRLGLISLVPNFIPPALGFGLWGYLVGYINLTASITTIIAFGIIVDDTIHFLVKYQEARREGRPAPEAVRFAFRTVGHALWTTTAVLSMGFLVFALSGFNGIWILGLMVSLMIILGIVIDFLFLPPLLMALDRKKL